jgi:hypothetical protein
MLRTRIVILTLLFSLLVTTFGVMSAAAQESDKSNVSIPDELTTELRVKVAYNGQDIFWLFEWPVQQAYYYHDVSVYRDGKWVQEGKSTVGPQEYGLYEDRLTFLVDPGTVQGFANQGCYTACHDGLRFLDNELDQDTVKSQAYLGDKGRTDLRKYLPDSRVGAEWWEAPWDSIKTQAELDALREAGVFLDFWHWRAHRGGPIGYADDQYVLEFRNNDGSKAAYATNWDADTGQPKFMFDPAKVGFASLNWDRLIAYGYSMDDVYYLSTDNYIAFDPDHKWQNGDVIPRRFLQQPEGSQAAITSSSTWVDGAYWQVELRRAMDTGFSTTDHAMVEGRTYNIGFAIHKNATGSRWHYISHNNKVGIGTPAGITAKRFDGATPDWNSIPWNTINMFYPGQITWEWLSSDAHPGALEIREDSRSCRDCHGENAASVLKMAQAAKFHELRDGRLSVNWWLTLLGGSIFLIGGTVVALNFSNYKES